MVLHLAGTWGNAKEVDAKQEVTVEDVQPSKVCKFAFILLA